MFATVVLFATFSLIWYDNNMREQDDVPTETGMLFNFLLFHSLYKLRPAVYWLLQIYVFQSNITAIPDVNRDIFTWGPLDDTWQDEIQRRKAHVRTSCAKQDVSAQSGAVGYFWVSEKYKILYCSVEKAGCSTTKLVLKRINDGKLLRRVKRKAVFHSDFFANYTKIMFVREPVERLISAFRYTIVRKAPCDAWIKEDIVRRYRSDRSLTSTQADVTFEEFIRYFVDGQRIVRYPVTLEDMCKPCQVNYDYIGKFETIEVDLANILMKFSNLTFDDAINFVPHANPSPGKSSAELADVYMQNLSAHLREQLYMTLKHDYTLFDYKYRW